MTRSIYDSARTGLQIFINQVRTQKNLSSPALDPYIGPCRDAEFDIAYRRVLSTRDRQLWMGICDRAMATPWVFRREDSESQTSTSKSTAWRLLGSVAFLVVLVGCGVKFARGRKRRRQHDLEADGGVLSEERVPKIARSDSGLQDRACPSSIANLTDDAGPHSTEAYNIAQGTVEQSRSTKEKGEEEDREDGETEGLDPASKDTENGETGKEENMKDGEKERRDELSKDTESNEAPGEEGVHEDTVENGAQEEKRVHEDTMEDKAQEVSSRNDGRLRKERQKQVLKTVSRRSDRTSKACRPQGLL